MKRLTLVLGLAVLGLAGGAQASSFIGTTDAIGGSLVNSIEGTSDATSSIGNDKVVLDARDDAASFVASDGVTRGVQLEAALQHKIGRASCRERAAIAVAAASTKGRTLAK